MRGSTEGWEKYRQNQYVGRRGGQWLGRSSDFGRRLVRIRFFLPYHFISPDFSLPPFLPSLPPSPIHTKPFTPTPILVGSSITKICFLNILHCISTLSTLSFLNINTVLSNYLYVVVKYLNKLIDLFHLIELGLFECDSRFYAWFSSLFNNKY